MAVHKENVYYFMPDYVIGYTYNTGTAFYIDYEDYEMIKPYCWLSDKSGYLIMQKNHKQTKMHRLIMKPPENMVVDHIDGNPTNNRRKNLRICNHQQNSMNSRYKPKAHNGVVGITWDKARKKWIAQICVKRKRIHLGRYDLQEDAIQARRKAEQRYFGEYAPNREVV